MYIYQSLATSILYTIKFLNILTSPSMCKQEDYFKKLIYMHNKNIFPCHASTGRPKPCRALGLETTEHSRFTSDWKLLFKPAVSLQSETKDHPAAVYRRKHFSLGNLEFGWIFVFWFFFFFLPVFISGWEGEGESEVIVTEKRKWEKKPTFEMYTFQKKTKQKQTIKPPTIYSLCHCTLIMPTC